MWRCSSTVERRPEEPSVGGSTPPVATTLTNDAPMAEWPRRPPAKRNTQVRFLLGAPNMCSWWNGRHVRLKSGCLRA
jgi:hypothetical protein